MRLQLRVAIIPLLSALAGCTPLRVDIAEQVAGGFTAVAKGRDADACREARTRVTDEARYHCAARGQRISLGKPNREADGAGCRVELMFWCTGSAE